MGIAERKSREREDRRRNILELTKGLVLEKGVDALSMQDIADAAELSKATLYLYFQSKESLFMEILDEATKSFCAYVEDRIDPEATGIEALNALWSSYIGLFGESEDIIILTGIMRTITPAAPLDSRGDDGTAGDDGIAGDDPPSGASHARMRSLIAAILERGRRDGTLDPAMDPRRLSRTVIMIAMAIIDNVARLPREARDPLVIKEDMKSTFELLLRGVAAEGTDRAALVLPTGP